MTWFVKIAEINFPFSVLSAKRISKCARNAKVLRLVKDLRLSISVEVKVAVALVQRLLGHLALVEQDVKEAVSLLHISDISGHLVELVNCLTPFNSD